MIVGLSLDRVRFRSTPFPGAHSRHLHLYVKTAPTPDRFPRRPGMARKRPSPGTCLRKFIHAMTSAGVAGREECDGSVPNCYGMPPYSDRLRH